MKLNLGSSINPQKGMINLDIAPIKDEKGKIKADIIADLNQYPYPFKDNSFDEIIAKMILEHLDDFPKPMKEMYRILKPGGKIIITVPHSNSPGVWLDPMHKRPGFCYNTFNYFEPDHAASYSYDFQFWVVKKKIVFGMRQPWNWIISFIANKCSTLYECTFLKMFPCIELYVELQKPPKWITVKRKRKL